MMHALVVMSCVRPPVEVALTVGGAPRKDLGKLVEIVREKPRRRHFMVGERTIYVPISTEGSDTPTARPKTGLGSRGWR